MDYQYSKYSFSPTIIYSSFSVIIGLIKTSTGDEGVGVGVGVFVGVFVGVGVGVFVGVGVGVFVGVGDTGTVVVVVVVTSLEITYV